MTGRCFAVRPLFAVLAVCFVFAVPGGDASAAEPAVGMVTKAEGNAWVVSSGSRISARIGTLVRMKDTLGTGGDARMQVTFRDDTSLTLGEQATVVIDRFVYDPQRSTGEAVIKASKGAIRFATGRIKGLDNKTITVATPVANIGVRGTEFWAGPLQQYGVLLLQPLVNVTNQGGSVILSAAGQGTDIASRLTAPGAPTFWSKAKIAQALAMTNFQGSPQQDRENQQENQKDGQNGSPGQDPQYTLARPWTFFAALGAQAGFAVIVLERDNDKDKPVSP